MSEVKKTRGLGLILGLVAVAFVTGAVLYVVNNQKKRSPHFADFRNAEMVALGEQVYEANCAICHGAGLEGQPNWRQPLASGGFPAPPHDETGHTWHHPDQMLFQVTKFGGASVAGEGAVSNMPAFEGILSDQEILASLAYIKSHWPAKIQDDQEKLTYRQTLRENR
ncbi:c-type cytochrome [Aestuariispira insulae]|uniref:Cbb3-type cytochrome c oxidase subunit III n=1 Tax=Aestuariispira insulae TaxID=1461337 RepID=A0A3D9HX49_9PROT|nr:cytochrome c [Aestuariispira insulae]RED54064.1 cbb3-type cytochrome c oxidase subunit III [Aestuariispira insulae]